MPRILVVDDDRTTLNLIGLQLRAAGHVVDTAPDGAAGLARLRRKRYDLVLLDVWMPGMDGLEVLSRLRGAPSRPRVIVMTADDAPETLLKAVREQAFGYVAKPVEPEELNNAIASALTRLDLAAGDTPVAIFTGAGLNYVLHAFGVQF